MASCAIMERSESTGSMRIFSKKKSTMLDNHNRYQDEEEIPDHVSGEGIVETGGIGDAFPIAVEAHLLSSRCRACR